MNNELLQRQWGELVGDAKAGCGALLFRYDDSIIAADELMKAQQAHIERLRDVVKNLTKIDHKKGGSLGDDGAFYYKVSEYLFKSAESCLTETPAQSLEAVKREWQVDEFDNNLLPKLGSEVFFHLSSSDSREPFTVTGFSVLNSLTGTDHRVFIHGVDSDGFKNVRLIQDIKEHNND